METVVPVSLRLIGIMTALMGIIVSSNSQLHSPFATPAGTFLIHQTHPWGFRYSFTEHKRNGININNIVPKTPSTGFGLVPLGISLLPQIPLVPLPIARNMNETLTGSGNTSSNSSTVTTTATPIEATSGAPTTEEATSALPTDAAKPEQNELAKDANTTFFLSSPLAFSYGFTAFDNSPLPVPQLPLLSLQLNGPPPKVNIADKGISNDVKVPKENDPAPASTTTTTSVGNIEQESTTASKTVLPDIKTDPSPASDTTTTASSTTTTEVAKNSEVTTQSAPAENEQNFETETIASTVEAKPLESKPLDKLQSEEGKSNEETTTTKTELPLTPKTDIQPSSTIATVEITGANTILLIDGNKSEFSYSIKDETTFDEKSHEEQRNGDSVKGKYSVVEPDGSLRTVTYTADGDGFKADVVRKESYTKPFPVWKNRISAAPGTISSTLSDQNVVSYYYNGFHSPPPRPQVPRNFGYGYYIVPNNWG